MSDTTLLEVACRGMFNEDLIIRTRSVDAVEKITASRPDDSPSSESA